MYEIEFIGQSKKKALINNLVQKDRMPPFLIIVGEVGSGKRTLCEYIANSMGVIIDKVADLKVDNIRQLIIDAQTLASKRIFLLANAEDMTNQAQNALLKLAEEPPENAYIIMTCSDRNKILGTILSRGLEIEMQPYTQEELEEYSSSEILCNLCNNIGEIADLEYTPFKKMMDFAETIQLNLDKVMVPNLLKIPQRVDFGDGKGEFGLQLLLRGLFFLYRTDYKMLKVLSKYKGLFERKGLNKKNLFDLMLLDMRGVELDV